jgi:hypothetical protein
MVIAIDAVRSSPHPTRAEGIQGNPHVVIGAMEDVLRDVIPESPQGLSGIQWQLLWFAGSRISACGGFRDDGRIDCMVVR